MTWEEIIISIRKQPEFSELVVNAYFDENLVLNVERFRSSQEYAETKKIIAQHYPSSARLNILDIGSGNGISAVSFSLDGNEVSVVEPDTSDTVGSGAVRKLRDHFKLQNFNVYDTYGEKLPFESNEFDVIYIRQAMHHANNLNQFVKEAARVLKNGGLFLTIRDHVVFDEKDKKWFLEMHPLHKYYGGENAFSFEEYSTAFKLAGLEIKRMLRFYDSVINYFPIEENDLDRMRRNRKELIESALRKKFPPFLSQNTIITTLYSRYVESKLGPAINEKLIPGRMYSFVALKPI